jgi:hypothetical protein
MLAARRKSTTRSRVSGVRATISSRLAATGDAYHVAATRSMGPVDGEAFARAKMAA